MKGWTSYLSWRDGTRGHSTPSRPASAPTFLRPGSPGLPLPPLHPLRDLTRISFLKTAEATATLHASTNKTPLSNSALHSIERVCPTENQECNSESSVPIRLPYAGSPALPVDRDAYALNNYSRLTILHLLCLYAGAAYLMPCPARV